MRRKAVTRLASLAASCVVLIGATASVSLSARSARATPWPIPTPSPVQPSLEVSHAGSLLKTGSIITFGEREQSSAPTHREFTLRNGGYSTLTVTSVDVPLGFSIVGAVPSRLQYEQSGVLTIQLTSERVGAHQGVVAILSNDPDDNPFRFSVKGEVVSPPPPSPAPTPTPTPIPSPSEVVLDFGGTTDGTYVNAVDANVGKLSIEGEVQAAHVQGTPHLRLWEVRGNTARGSEEPDGYGVVRFPQGSSLLVNGLRVTPGTLLQTHLVVAGRTRDGARVVLFDHYTDSDVMVSWYIPPDVVAVEAIWWRPPLYPASWPLPDYGTVGQFQILNDRTRQADPLQQARPWEAISVRPRTFSCPADLAAYYDQLERLRLTLIRSLPNPLLVRGAPETVAALLALYYPRLVDPEAEVERRLDGYRGQLSEGKLAEERRYLADQVYRERRAAEETIRTNLLNFNHNMTVYLNEAAKLIDRYGPGWGGEAEAKFNAVFDDGRTETKQQLGLKDIQQAYVRVSSSDVFSVALANYQAIAQINEKINEAKNAAALDPGPNACGGGGGTTGPSPSPSPSPSGSPPPQPSPSPPAGSDVVLSGEEEAQLESVLAQLSREFGYVPSVEVANAGRTILTPTQRYNALLRDSASEAERISAVMRTIRDEYTDPKVDKLAESVIGIFEPIISYGVSESARMLPQAKYLPSSLRSYHSAVLRGVPAATRAMRLGGSVIGFGSEVEMFAQKLHRSRSQGRLTYEVHQLVDEFAIGIAGKGVVILAGSFVAGPVGLAVSLTLVLIPMDEIFSDTMKYTRDCPVKKMLGLPDVCKAYRTD